MNGIIRDFVKRELTSFVKLAVLFAVLCGILVYLQAEIVKWLPLVLAALAAMLLRLFSTATWDFRLNWREAQFDRQAKIAEEYGREHLVLPVYLGELHMLSDCLIWRSRRRLVLLLAEDIERVKVARLSGAVDLYFYTNAGKKYTLEFLAGQRAKVPKVLDWLRGLPREIGGKLEIEGGESCE